MCAGKEVEKAQSHRRRARAMLSNEETWGGGGVGRVEP
jgi:hypothetical protein